MTDENKKCECGSTDCADCNPVKEEGKKEEGCECSSCPSCGE